MKRIFILIVFSLIYQSVSAQNNFSVKGNIVTKEDYPISGNVIALTANDSTFVKGDFFMDGTFVLNDLPNQALIIKLSSLEFDNQFFNINFEKESHVDLGIIELDKAGVQMDEVVITRRRPTYVQQANGTIAVLIENSSLASSNSVTEILSRSPDVLIDEEGQISLFGKSNTLLYLNGKRIDQTQLDLIPPSNIKKIVIIRNPSSKYDAEGSSVIEILTISNTAQGHQVKLLQNLNYSNFAGANTYSDFNIVYNRGKLSTRLNYSLTQGKDRHILHTTRNRLAEEIFIKTDLTTEWKNDYKNYSKFGMGTQYDLTDRSYLSLEYSGFYEQLGGEQISSNTIEDLMNVNHYQSEIQRRDLFKNNNYSLNFNQSLDTIGSQLFAGGQYSNFDFTAHNPITEMSMENNQIFNRSLKINTDLNINIISAQLDYTKAFHNQSTMQLGMKYSDVNNNSVSNFFIVEEDNNLQLVEALSNNFDYDESIGSVYLSYNSQLNTTLKYNIGLRSEYTRYNLRLSQLEGLEIKDDYLNIFPQLSITKIFDDQRSINFSYTSRIRRVPYQRLNPVLIYQDPYTSIQGNAESIPEKIHTFEVNSSVQNFNFRLGYSYTIDPFGGGAVRGDDDRSYILKRLNFDSKHQYFASISRTFETNWLSSNNTFNLRYTDIIDNQFDFEDVGSRPNVYFYSNNRIPIKNWFNNEFSFYYLGDNDEGLYQRKSSWNLSWGVSKNFLDNALKCQVLLNDIFHSVRAAGDYSIGETDIYFARKWNTNYVRFSLSYNFGQLKKDNYRNTAVGSNENNRAR